MRWSRPAWPILLLLIVSWARAASWYEFYQPAEEALNLADQAVEAGNTAQADLQYRTAIDLLNQALALRPKPLLRARTYGISYIPYLPFYQLGRAYEGLGQKQRAIENYQSELAKEAILGSPELTQDLRHRLERLQTPAKPSPSRTATLPASATPTQPPRTARPTSTPTASATQRKVTPSRTRPPTASATATRTRTPTRTVPPEPTNSPTSSPTPSSTRTPTAYLRPLFDQPDPGLFVMSFDAFDPRGIERVELYIDTAFQNAWENPSLEPHLQATYEFPLPDGTYEAKLVLMAQGGLRSITQQERLRSGSPSLRPVFIAGGVGLLTALGGSLLIRARRRRRALARSFNPYIAGSPVQKDDMFFGRTALLQQVLSTLHNNSLLLFGERRIGKTSLLHSIYRHVRNLQDKEYEFNPVLIDLEGVPEEGFFPILISEILAQLDKKLGQLPVRWRPGLPKGEYDSSDFVHDLRLVVKQLRDSTTKIPKLLLLLDEVDVLNTFSSRTNQRLRSLFMKTFGQHLGLVMAGVGIRKSWDSEGSPWYNFFEEIPVKPFSTEEARELIRRPVEGIFTYSQDAVERILEACGNKPYLIQRCCIACVNRLSAEGRFQIGVEDVEAVLPNVLGGWE